MRAVLRLGFATFSLVACVHAVAGAHSPRPAAAAAQAPAAHEISAAEVFGFTEGSDVAGAREWGAALDFQGGFSKRLNPFSAGTGKLEVGYGLTDNIEIVPHLVLGYGRLRDPDTMNVRSAGGVVGIGTEFKFRLLDRSRAPFGVTLVAEPQIGWFDDAEVAHGQRRALETKLLIDRELIPDRLFAAANVSYGLDWFKRRGLEEQPDGTFAPFATERASTLGFSGAIATRAAEAFFIGGEARYLRAYDGFGLSQLSGEALFVGPTLHLKLGGTVGLTAAWSTQVWGREAGVPGRLDLDNFSRHQARLKLSFELSHD